jgi:hypothetical protein
VEASDFDAIFIALQAANVRYIVVGGVAVVLHGSPRFTADLDLVIALEDENVRLALGALERLGYRPRAPVPAQQFADPETRRSWIEDKGLTVFSLWSPDHPATEIDIFVEEPFPFDDAYARAVQADLGTSTVTVASIPDLIVLKRRAGRPKDLADISALEALSAEVDGDE